VVRDLHDMGLDVAVIDHSPDDAARETLDRLSVPAILGDARSAATLAHADLDHADTFVVCTGNDRVNLEVSMKVREIRDDIQIVARIWDQGLGRRMEQFGMVDTAMSAADLSAPAFAGAALGIEITQTLEVKGVEYSTVRLTVGRGSFLNGARVGELEDREALEVVLVHSGDEVTVDPGAEVTLGMGDGVVIFARHDRVLEVVTRNRPRRG